MAEFGAFGTICGDGRLIPVPAGVFFHDGPMTRPVDPSALQDALLARRLPGRTTVFATEETLASPLAVTELRRVLDRLPERARREVVLGTLPGSRTDPATLLERADVLGLPVHAPVPAGPPPWSARVIGVDDDGRETTDRPRAVVVLPRARAATREALRAAVELAGRGDRTPWQRLTEWLSTVQRIRDDLRVPSWSAADESRSPAPDATYQLGVALVWAGVPAGVDPAELIRAVRPYPMADALALLGTPEGEPLPPGTPGTAALLRAPGGDRATWLVAEGGRLWWVEPRVDGPGAVRALDPADLPAALHDRTVLATSTPGGPLTARNPAGAAPGAHPDHARAGGEPPLPGTAIDVPGLGRCMLLAVALGAPHEVAALPGMPADALARLLAARADRNVPAGRLDDIAEALRRRAVALLTTLDAGTPLSAWLTGLYETFPQLPDGVDLRAELLRIAGDWAWHDAGPALAGAGEEGLDLGGALLAVLAAVIDRPVRQVRLDGDGTAHEVFAGGTGAPLYVGYRFTERHYQAWVPAGDTDQAREFVAGRRVAPATSDDPFEALLGSVTRQGLHEWLHPLGERSAAALRRHVAARLADPLSELDVPLETLLTPRRRAALAAALARPVTDATPGAAVLRYLARATTPPTAREFARAALSDPALRGDWTDGVLLGAAALALDLTAVEVPRHGAAVTPVPAPGRPSVYVLRDGGRYAALGRAIGAGTPLTERETETVHGMPVENQRRIQRFVDAENIVLDFRPTNPHAVPYLRVGAVPKPMEVKDKTIGATDALIGATDEVLGLVGTYEPAHPVHVAEELRQRYEARAAAWEAASRSGGPVPDRGADRVFELHGLLYLYEPPAGDRRYGTYRQITADHDPFDILDADTGERITGARYERLVDALRGMHVAVQHGAHLSWQAPPEQRGMSVGITRQHHLGEGVVRFRPWPAPPGPVPLWDGNEAPPGTGTLPPANVSLVDGAGERRPARPPAPTPARSRSGLPDAPTPAMLPPVRHTRDTVTDPIVLSRRSSLYQPQPSIPDGRRPSDPRHLPRRDSATGWPSSRRPSLTPYASMSASPPPSRRGSEQLAPHRPVPTGWPGTAPPESWWNRAATPARRPSPLPGADAIFRPDFTFGAPPRPDTPPLTEPPRAVTTASPMPPSPARTPSPVPYSAEGMRELSTRIRRAIGAGSGEVYCATAVSLARDELFGRRGVTLTPQDGRSRDDLTTHGGIWAGWGAPVTWPRVADWDEIARLVGAEVGRTAFVLTGRPGSYGHAFLVVHTEDGVLWVDPSARAQADRVRTHAEMTAAAGPLGPTVVDLRTRVFAADGTAVPVTTAAPESARPAATALAMTDHAERRYRGSGIEDEQTVMLFFDRRSRAEDLAGRPLAKAVDGSWQIEVETKTFYLADGRYHATRAAADATGGEVREVVAGMIERVSSIMSTHPHEVNRAAPGPVFDAFARMAAAADLIPGADGEGAAMKLTAFLAGEKVEFTTLGTRTMVGRPPVGDVPGSHYHYTHGIVLSGLRDFLAHVRENTWRTTALGYRTRAHLADGLAFGDALALRFREFLRTPGAPAVADADRAATELAGYAALFYDNFAGVAHHLVNEHELNKVNIAVLSRVPAFADLRRLLPAAVREYLDRDADRIWTDLEALFRARIPDFDERYRVDTDLEPDAPVEFGALGVGHSEDDDLTLRQYADSAIRGDAARITQRAVLGSGVTDVPVDVATSGLLRPHVVVEVRSYGARRESAERARGHNAALAAIARAAYERELAVPADRRAADGRAWLEGGADRALRWVNGEGDAPPWAVALGELAAARGHALVLSGALQEAARPGRQNGHGAAVRRLLDEAPHLARTAIVAVTAFDAELNDLRQEHRLTVVHAVDRVTRDATGTHRRRGWRLVTAANTVLDLGDGALTGDLLARALDEADGTARAGIEAGRTPPVPELLRLGDWTGADAQRLLTAITTHAVPDRPMIAVGLSGAEAPEAIRRLGETLHAYRRAGVSPVVLTTAGTRQTAEPLDRVLAEHRPVLIRPVTDGLDQAWQAEHPDGTVARRAPLPDADLFAAAAAVPAPPAGPSLPDALARWLLTPGWPEAEAYQREHHAALREPAVLEALRAEAAAFPDDVRLGAFRTALELAAPHDRLPAERLTPVATTVLDQEPPYDRGAVPPAFVYDYLSRDGGRRGRFPMDGLLFQLVLAGAVTRDQALALVRATATTAVDRANLTVFEVVTALREAEADHDPLAHPLVRRLREVTGSAAIGCVDPIDRAAWVGRMDALAKAMRAEGTDAATRRADLLDVATDTLSTC
ncbi:hypothetical protein [Catenuloplanes atrovinosus]|uniref:Uncharacterized protein n=1 Tax=Catenuloplanes atrovinosus TaxID=137266 RepID=A0AAE3YNE7_9ACTN|nr:hypothetical protein [Catenuloplanes atrovinosus]MDR7276740.1 hypothetical protein [Catenuloplanes atrovinosus]